MSALPLIAADHCTAVVGTTGHNRTHSPQQRSPLFNELIGDREKGSGDLKAHDAGGLQIDDEFKLARLHHRQVGQLLPSEDASGPSTT